MRNALLDVFMNPLRHDLVAETLSSDFYDQEQTNVILKSSVTTPDIFYGADLEDNLKIACMDPTSNADSLKNTSSGQPFFTQELPRFHNSSRPEIAIVGMSGRFLSADDLEQFWDLLYQGLDVHERVPNLRWDEKTHVDVSGEGKNTSATPYGCWLKQPDLFDARFFGMSPREALQVDPAQRLALLTAYEALEQAGIVTDRTTSTQRDRIGVCYGVTSNDWMETNSAQNIDAYFIPGGNRAFIPGRINYHFKLSGPSYSIDTACSSSLTAIQLACNILWQGDAGTMIAGGTNILTNPDMTSGLDKGHFLTRKGNCRTFDETADGYCRVEGVATVVMKRLDDAIADNDPILGVILETCTNHSAESASITRPYCGAQQSLFHKALGTMSPSVVDYIEMHGTGTQVGDATEMDSVLKVFAPSTGSHRRPRDRPVYLGSVKPNVGHGGAVAGVTSLIKVLLMMQHRVLPPHCGIKTAINSKFPSDLSSRGINIVKQPSEWNRSPETPRTAMINSFSAAGGNTVLLLQEFPEGISTDNEDPRKYHSICISAKSRTALEANTHNIIQFIRQQSRKGLDLSSLSYTSTVRRVHHGYRICANGSTGEEIALGLSRSLDLSSKGQSLELATEVILAFSGQGSQYFGMGKDLYEHLSSFRADIRRYNGIALSQGFCSILPVMLEDQKVSSHCPPGAFQLAMTCLQLALVRLWLSWGIEPRAVVGHSIGHYAALNAAGVLSEAEVIFLVGLRGQILAERFVSPRHCMAAVNISPLAIRPFLDSRDIEISCINGPNSIVLGGEQSQMKILQSTLASEGIIVTPLNTSCAFHTSQMDSVLKDFALATGGVTFRPASIPIICPLNGGMLDNEKVLGPSHTADHLRKPVKFFEAMTAARDSGHITPSTIFLEIGPGSAICRMIKLCLGDATTTFPSLGRMSNSWKHITSAVSMLYRAGANINWAKYHAEFTHAQRVLRLPSYSWDLESYWIQYRNDWSLRKGDPLAESQGGRPSILSTTIHGLIDEKVNDGDLSVTVQSDLSHSALDSIVQGHKVGGLPLCTPVRTYPCEASRDSLSIIEKRFKPTTVGNKPNFLR